MQQDLMKAILEFREKRDWSQFHDPKNLAEAISIEAGELLEIFLWKTCEQSRDLSEEDEKRVAEEIADIFIFLSLLCHEHGFDIEEIVKRKLETNEKKYPREKSRGTAKKYTELEK